jgi:hypothetical protein
MPGATPWASTPVRVHGEEQGDLGAHVPEGREQSAEDLGIVDVGRPVQGHQAVAVRGQSEAFEHGAQSGPFHVGEERVDHDVADEVDLIGSVALGVQVLDRVGRRGQEVVAHPIGDDPVHLLGHRPVAAAQPGFDVRHQRTGLGRDDGARHGRVHVAHDDDHIGAEVGDQRLEGDHHACGLLGVGTGARAEVHVGRAEPELVEEGAAHRLVVVLAGVHQDAVDPCGFERIDDRLDLHEVGPGPGHADRPHARGA